MNTIPTESGMETTPRRSLNDAVPGLGIGGSVPLIPLFVLLVRGDRLGAMMLAHITWEQEIFADGRFCGGPIVTGHHVLGERLHVSAKQANRTLEKLGRLGLLESRYDRTNHRLLVRVDLDALVEQVEGLRHRVEKEAASAQKRRNLLLLASTPDELAEIWAAIPSDAWGQQDQCHRTQRRGTPDMQTRGNRQNVQSILEESWEDLEEKGKEPLETPEPTGISQPSVGSAAGAPRTANAEVATKSRSNISLPSSAGAPTPEAQRMASLPLQNPLVLGGKPALPGPWPEVADGAPLLPGMEETLQARTPTLRTDEPPANADTHAARSSSNPSDTAEPLGADQVRKVNVGLPGRTVRRAKKRSSAGDADPMDWCARIYQEYPRKKHPDDAKKAIARALREMSGEELLRRTSLYAASVKDKDLQYVPYPASWFNAGGHKEDPAAWEAVVPRRPHDSFGEDFSHLVYGGPPKRSKRGAPPPDPTAPSPPETEEERLSREYMDEHIKKYGGFGTAAGRPRPPKTDQDSPTT